MQLTPYDKDELRKTVPGPAVAASLGIRVSGDLAVCPFHDDHAPSLSFYVDNDGVQRWGCFPCGVGGDVFDLVQRVKHVSFAEAIKYVSTLSGVVTPAPPPQPQPLDLEGLSRLVTEARENALQSKGLLSVAASLSSEPDKEYDWVLRGLGWGVQADATIVIPHWTVDGRLTGCKFRDPSKNKWAYPNSRFEDLYGAWRILNRPSILITEGETDLAHAVRELESEVNVVALPTGAARMLPRWVREISHWPRIYLGFDGDEAGVLATRRWVTALSEHGAGAVYVLQVPIGEDLRSCGIGVRDLMQGSYRAV